MELVVVIAILGILAGLAIPRFMDATTNARGSRLVADLRTIESAESMYYAEKGQFATMKELVDNGYLAVEPIPPIGAFKVAETNQAGEIKDTVIFLLFSLLPTPLLAFSMPYEQLFSAILLPLTA